MKEHKKARDERFKKRIRRRNKIERDLLDQIKDRNNSRYQELIKDYLFMWDTIQELKHDIEERGVSVYWQNSATQFGYKENDSIRAMTTVNQQMLRILGHLGIELSSEEADANEEVRL